VTKNKSLILIILLLLSFILGFSFDRFEIFQYKKIVKIKDCFLKIKSCSKTNIDFRNTRNDYPEYSYPNPDYIEIFVEKYKLGTNIFSNRNYRNLLNNEILDGLLIIKLPIYYQKKIKLKVFKDIKIFRVTCEKNINSYLDDWNEEKQEILIISGNCIHRKIFSRKLITGTYYIEPGGPIAADPIFIEQDEYKGFYFKASSK